MEFVLRDSQTRRKRIQFTRAVVLCCLMLAIAEGSPERNFGAESGNLGSLVVHVVDPHSNRMVLPDTVPLPGVKSTALLMSACRGEFESASFVVRPLVRNMSNVTFALTDLKGPNGTIPARNIDLAVVKVWYQGGNAWSTIWADKSERLVPELLLHDDSLIRVDRHAKMNHVRLVRDGVAAYQSISDRKLAESRQVLHSPDSLPIKDEETLLPLSLHPEENKQFVLRIHVPEDVVPGDYEGHILVGEGETSIGSLSLKLTVYPFKLELPGIEYSIYYRGVLTRHAGTISAEGKTEVQLRAELQDMWDHGVTNPASYQPLEDRQLLRAVLNIRRSIGMVGKPLYYLGVATGNPDSQQAIASYVKAVAELKVLAKEFGLPEVYIYGIDEAPPDMIRRQRKAWQAVHDAGGRIFSAGWTAGHFELLGDIVDLFIDGQPPKKSEADKFHSARHRVFSYNTPQAGVENPLVYRKNYGLRLWQQDYDGAMTYAYQDGFGSIWNDFDHMKFRDHNFTYPTVDGVIDTIAWEGFREGVDDVRYVMTLQRALAAVDTLDSRETQSVVQEARAFLDELREYRGDDLAGMRRRIVSYLLRIGARQPSA